jgi:hypothetical protein
MFCLDHFTPKFNDCLWFVSSSQLGGPQPTSVFLQVTSLRIVVYFTESGVKRGKELANVSLKPNSTFSGEYGTENLPR